MKKTIVFIVISLFINSCNKDDVTCKLDGYAQKGPFINGANVTIIELDKTLVPTGKSYYSVIDDNSGHFSFPEITLGSNFVQLKVEGNCYNEITGDVPTDYLTLFSIVSVSNNSSVNVNILSHFEQGRILNLILKGTSFEDAQKQAQNEILKVFNLEDKVISNPEQLNIISSNLDGGVLLFLSSIIENNIGSSMTTQEFITNFATDFKEDGIINSDVIQRTLAGSAYILDLERTTANLMARYSDMGMNINPYEMTSLRKQFLNNTSFRNVFYDLFPHSIGNAKNLLIQTDTIMIDKNSNYCIAINDNLEDCGLDCISLFLTASDYNNISIDLGYWAIGNGQLLSAMCKNDGDYMIPISFTNNGEIILELIFWDKNSNKPHYYPKKHISWK